MRLSEAIMLGSTQAKLDPTIWYNRDKACGCLIGLGIAGCNFLTLDANASTDEVVRFWPWLAEPRFEMPEDVEDFKYRMGFDGCSGFGSTYPNTTAIEIISGMARMVKDGAMTFETAVDWIRSVEPEEPKEDATIEPQELPEATDVHLRDLQAVESV